MISRIFLFTALLPAAWGQTPTLHLGDPAGSTGTATVLPLSLAGHPSITGLQFDLVYPSGHAKGGTAVSAVEGTNHKAEAREVSPGRTRVVLYSPTNLPLPLEAILQLPLVMPPGAPAGGPDVTVQNLKFITTAGQLLTPSIQYGTITQWRKTHFTPLERADASIIGDDRDPDGDGLSNLGELAGAANPKVFDSDHAPQTNITVDPDNRSYLTVRYRQGKGVTAAMAEVKTSTDLQNWVLANPPAVPTGNSDATTIEVEARVEVTGPRQFLNLKFLRTPPVTP